MNIESKPNQSYDLEELTALVNALCDDRINDQQAERLNAILASSEEAMEFYVHSMWINTSVERYFGNGDSNIKLPVVSKNGVVNQATPKTTKANLKLGVELMSNSNVKSQAPGNSHTSQIGLERGRSVNWSIGLVVAAIIGMTTGLAFVVSNGNKSSGTPAVQRQTEEGIQSGKTIADARSESTEVPLQSGVSDQEAQRQVDVLQLGNTNLKARLKQLTNQIFDHPDGEVIGVASALDSISINIGTADGLTTKRTFAVYDQSTIDFVTATPKAYIEVVRVSQFRSEARIIKTNPTDPILRGDLVFAPIGDRNCKQKIALVGHFDLNGDRYDDTDKLIRLVEQNGGEVVVSHDEKGNVIGEMASEVRYLVKGKKALTDAEDDNAEKILAVMDKMQADAERDTVEVIDLQEFLNRMGIRVKPKIKQLDFPTGGFAPRKSDSSQAEPSTP